MSYCAHCGTQVPTLAPPCPACGKPPSGAPPPMVARASTNAALIVAVVAVAGLVIVAIIGVLAAIAVPNLLNAIERAKQKRAMADLRTIGTALDAYAKDKNQYPPGSSVEELKPLLVPTYMAALPERDSWNWKLHYMCWQEDPRASGCDRYRLASGGKDGIFEHVDLREYVSRRTDGFDCDIVYESGTFVQWPAGFSD